MNSNPSSRASRHLYSSRDRVSVKKPFTRAIGLDKVVGIFLKNFVKSKESIVPWVAPEQGAFLHWCEDARYSAPNIVANM
jgi:hypothetical protein